MKLKPSIKDKDDEENDREDKFSSSGISSTLKLLSTNDMCKIITITQYDNEDNTIKEALNHFHFIRKQDYNI